MQQLAAIADIGGILGHICDFVRHGGEQLPQSVKGAAAGSAEQYPAVMQAAYLVKYGAGQLGLPLRQQSAVQIKDHCAHERIASNSSHTSRQDRGASRTAAARESASVRRSAPSACSMR